MWQGFVSVYFVDFSQAMHCPKFQSSGPMPQVLDSRGPKMETPNPTFFGSLLVHFTKPRRAQGSPPAGYIPLLRPGVDSCTNSVC